MTLVSVRGLSGSRPLWTARQAAKICAGTMYGIGVRISLTRRGRRMTRVARAVHFAVAGIGDGHDFGLQTLQFGEGFADRWPCLAGRREGEDREILLDQGDGAVQEIGGGEALGHHVAGLHQLQRHFEGVGVVQAAPHHHGMAHEAVALGEGVDLGLQGQGGADHVGMRSRSAIRTPPPSA